MTNLQQESLDNNLLSEFEQEWQAGTVGNKGYTLNPGAGMTGWENPYTTALENIWTSLTEPFTESNPNMEYNLQGNKIVVGKEVGDNIPSFNSEVAKSSGNLVDEAGNFVETHSNIFIIFAVGAVFILLAMGGK